METLIKQLNDPLLWRFAVPSIADGDLFPVLQRIIRNQDVGQLDTTIAFLDACLSEGEAKFCKLFHSFDAPWDSKAIFSLIPQVKVFLQQAYKAINSLEPDDWVDQAILAASQNDSLAMITARVGNDWPIGFRYLLKNGDALRRRVDVPVALYVPGEDGDPARGFLATLRLERVESNITGVFQHPQDFFTKHEPDFHQAMRDSWKAAQSLTANPNHVPAAGCWRLLDATGKRPLHHIGGNSASAAAALGWFHLYQDTNPDKGVIVMAVIDEEGQLSGVDGIKEKVVAVAEDGHFDTVVVASEENRGEARRVLAEQFHGSHLRVDLPENLVKGG